MRLDPRGRGAARRAASPRRRRRSRASTPCSPRPRRRPAARSRSTPSAPAARFALGPDTTLAEPPQDITVTPDGRFAYVLTTPPGASTIVRLARVAANGRLEPARRRAPRTPARRARSSSTRRARGSSTPSRAARSSGARSPPTARSARRTRSRSPDDAAARRALAGDDRRRAQPLRGRLPGHGQRADLAVRRRSGDRGRDAEEPGRGQLAGGGRPDHRRRADGDRPVGQPPVPRDRHAGAGIGRWAIDPGSGALTGRRDRRTADRRLRRGSGRAVGRRRRAVGAERGRHGAVARADPPVRGRRRRRADAARAAGGQLRRRRRRRATSSPAPTGSRCTSARPAPPASGRWRPAAR